MRSRISIGDSPHASASRSICDSYAKHAWTAPNPRIAPHGGLFVYTPYASIQMLSTRYGPTPSEAALPTTAGVDEQYAPPSRRISALT